jgi:Fur family peroxide stress response transcriptional regulator
MQQTGGRKQDEFVRISREQGLKVTPQRTAVYEAVAALDTHPSAEEVYRIAKKKLPHISFDTVNRTLLTFAEHGIIEILESVSGVRRFDPNIDQHHHLQCVRCGKVIDFEYQGYNDLPVPERVRQDFTVVKTRVCLTGICRECGKKEQSRGDSLRGDNAG